MSDYFDLKNEFNSMVEKARIELKGDCPLIEDAAILAASERIAELENQWVSVEDRLPSYGVPVLLFGNGTVQHVTYMLDGADETKDWFEPYYFEHDGEQKIPYNKPTHWMSLPEPPKESGWLRDSNTHVNKSKEQDE